MRRGASLVEIILAVSLAGLVLIFLFGLLPSTTLLSQDAEQQIEANRYAEEILAHLYSRSFDEIKALSGSSLTALNPGPFASLLQPRKAEGRVDLQATVTVGLVPGKDRLLQIDVDVRWKSGRRSKNTRLVRRISSVR